MSQHEGPLSSRMSERQRRVVTLFGLSMNEQAVEEARRDLAEAPGDADLHRMLAAALCQQGNPDEAEEVARQAVALNPHNPDNVSTLGVILMKQGRHEEARGYHARAIAVAPVSAAAPYGWGPSCSPPKTGLVPWTRPGRLSAWRREKSRTRPICSTLGHWERVCPRWFFFCRSSFSFALLLLWRHEVGSFDTIL